MWLQRTGRALDSIQQGPASPNTRYSNTSGKHHDSCTRRITVKHGEIQNPFDLLTFRDCIPAWEHSHGSFSELLESTTAHLAPFLSQQLPEMALSFYWILVNINLSVRSARHSHQYMSRYFCWAFQGPKTPAIQGESGNDGSFNNYKTFYCFAF